MDNCVSTIAIRSSCLFTSPNPFPSCVIAYAQALYRDDGATLDDLRESVETFEDVARIARRVLGNAHPLTSQIERDLRKARAALAARETPPTSNNA